MEQKEKEKYQLVDNKGDLPKGRCPFNPSAEVSHTGGEGQQLSHQIRKFESSEERSSTETLGKFVLMKDIYAFRWYDKFLIVLIVLSLLVLGFLELFILRTNL